MLVGCHRSEQWLRQTIWAWMRPAIRHASTTSAIKRGLRATRTERDGNSRTARDRIGRSARDGGAGTARDGSAETARRSDDGARTQHGSEKRIRFGSQRTRAENINALKIIEQPGSRNRDRRRDLPAVQRSSTTRGHLRDARRQSNQRGDPVQRHGSSSRPLSMECSILMNALRRVRAMETRRPRFGRNQQYRRKMADLQSMLDRINTQPDVLEQVRSEFPPSSMYEQNTDIPVTVEGTTSPTVSRTTLWLRPDATFGLALPGSGISAPAEERNARSTIRRMAFLIRVIQKKEQSGETPNESTTEELLDSVEQVKLALRTGEWTRSDVTVNIDKHMGEDGKLWNSTKRTSAGTYLYVGEDGKQLDLVRHEPSGAQQTLSKSKALNGSRRPLSCGDGKQEGDDVPVSVPYSTAASEFIYGYNTVLAALRAQRRKLYHLYLHRRSMARDVEARAFVKIAKQLNLPTTDNANLRLLDKMSEDRPHNGVVLEASRLPAPPLLSLASPNLRTSVVPLVLHRQNAEDIAVNGAPGALPTLSKTWRYPFVLMLDAIVDPGNVGNILRTAHFYGVDAVVISTNTSAPLTSAPLAKASSGACEALRIFALPKPSNFVYDSAKAGWHIYAAVAPQSDTPAELRKPVDFARNVTTSSVAQFSPLTKHPVILMLGAEGEGLRENLVKRADRFISIEQGERATDGDNRGDVGVDSLNVSTAAGVLIEAFMRKPEGAKELSRVGELGF